MGYSKKWKRLYGSELRNLRASGDKDRLKEIIGHRAPVGYSDSPEAIVVEAMHKKKKKRAKIGGAIKGMQRRMTNNLVSEG